MAKTLDSVKIEGVCQDWESLLFYCEKLLQNAVSFLLTASSDLMFKGSPGFNNRTGMVELTFG